MKHIASVVLYFFCSFLIASRIWIKYKFGKITAEQILFFVYTDTHGTDKSLLASFAIFVIIIPLILSIGLGFLQKFLDTLNVSKINLTFLTKIKRLFYILATQIAGTIKKYFSTALVLASLFLLIYAGVQTQRFKIEKSKFYKESAAYTGEIMEHYYTGSKNDILSNPEYLIAHAGGALLKPEPYLFYTNSQEAVKNSLHNGFKYIEIDIQQLKDGRLVAFHDIALFRNLTQDNPFKPGPLTVADFKTKKIQGLYTPIKSIRIWF